MKHSSLCSVILAAGKSGRFVMPYSKILAPLCGYPMVVHALNAVRELSPHQCMVVGHQADEVINVVAEYAEDAMIFARQVQMMGTGDAVRAAQVVWDAPEVAHILVVNGDCPLVTTQVLHKFYEHHLAKGAAVSLAVTTLEKPSGYGRVINEQGLVRIVEEKEASAEERKITLVNAGVYLIRKEVLRAFLSEMKKHEEAGEFYITDIVSFAQEKHGIASMYHVPAEYALGINSVADLVVVEQIMRKRVVAYWLGQGVRFEHPDSVILDATIDIAPGVTIGAGVHLKGDTVIHEGAVIETYSVLENSFVGRYARVLPYSVLTNATVHAQASIGPFARLRNGAIIGESATVGNFVEVKNSELAPRSKAKHLAYIGDATVGQATNIGAGVVICNFDGVEKHHTTIGSNVMVGGNATLVAPVVLQDESYIAAGSTITKSVPQGALGIGRSRQENKEEWSVRKKMPLAYKDSPELSQ